jgi:outer membrane protein OmpA-like peptidoglycan-associated protein
VIVSAAMKTLTRLSSALLLLAAPSCSLMSKLPGLSPEPQTSVVFALGTRDGFQSPLQSALKPACPALDFPGEGYALTGGHRKALTALAAGWSSSKPKYLIAGYVAPRLPEDFARALTERRAQAVRQQLIEGGIEASHLQTVGFGFDSSPSSPTSSVVVIYQQ